MRWYATIYVVKLLVKVQTFILNNFKAEKPTYFKTYPVLPTIRNNIFLPPSWKNGDPPLPLLIDIHGGGFTIGTPTLDNADNYHLASYGICVVSIGYRLAPGHKFPGPVHDVALLIDAVLNDLDLPVDKTKVAIAGYSAGGNLALAAPQLNNLHTRIKGVVAYYPATDTGRPMLKRLQTAVAPNNRKDVLISMSPMFHWAYFPKNVDLDDPLLAPLKADRRVVCEKVYLLGCERDLLCTEAEETAEAYAEAERKAGGVGRRVEIGGGRVGWTEGNVTWEKLMGLEHGFNQRMMTVRGKEKEFWRRSMLEMHKNVVEWLFREVYV